MPLRITPSKGPLPVGKRSSLRNKSYEVEPAYGRKIHPSRGYAQPIRPPPLSDDEAALFHTSRAVQRYNPAQPPPEITPERSLLKNAERLKTRLDLNYNPNVEQLKKPQTKFSQE